MENKDIDKAAREYAECSTCKGCDTEESIKYGSYDGFISGVQSRQSEIDELIEALGEATRWNFGIVKAANEMGLPGTDVTDISRTVLKATQLLEKYKTNKSKSK